MKTLLLSAAVALTATTASSAVITLTFDEAGFDAGDVVTSFSDSNSDGETVSGTVSAFNNPDGDINQAMIFDSSTLSGGDTDLVAPFYRTFTDTGEGLNPTDGKFPGNILIISEDGDSTDPDDNGKGGTITFKFDQLVNFLGFRVFDDVRDFTVTSNNGDETDPVTLPYDNQFTRVDTLFIGIEELTFNFGSASGAIDNLRFELFEDPQINEVPVPASLPLLLAGLGGLVAVRRRKG